MENSSRAVVRRLCEELGYAGSKEAKSRSRSTFRSLTISFRKDFEKESSGVLSFDLNSRASRQCAEEFLQKNPNLFADSLEARVRKWPTLPKDKDTLVKLYTLL